MKKFTFEKRATLVGGIPVRRNVDDLVVPSIVAILEQSLQHIAVTVLFVDAFRHASRISKHEDAISARRLFALEPRASKASLVGFYHDAMGHGVRAHMVEAVLLDWVGEFNAEIGFVAPEEVAIGAEEKFRLRIFPVDLAHGVVAVAIAVVVGVEAPFREQEEPDDASHRNGFLPMGEIGCRQIRAILIMSEETPQWTVYPPLYAF